MTGREMKLTIGIVVCLQLCAKFLAHSIPEQEVQVFPRCKDSQFAITVDNGYELYIDGAQVTSGLPNANTWQTADTVWVPVSARIIAIKGIDWGGIAGILASGADATTDDSWKCTSTLENGWTAVDFDDSAWPNATVIADHVVSSPWKTTIEGISSDAKWIWTPNYITGTTSDKTFVYCRKRRDCNHGTGSTCITSCRGKANGKYQSCKTCYGFATCSNGCFRDKRPCPTEGFVWDDGLKRCVWESTTCIDPDCEKESKDNNEIFYMYSAANIFIRFSKD